MTRWVEYERATCGRPITADEVEALEELGAALRSFRESAGLTRATLALRSGLSKGHINKIERACRRTRVSTLTSLATAIADGDEVVADAMLTLLVDAAGDTIVAPNRFSERRERNRPKRQAKADRLAAAALPAAEQIAKEILRSMLAGSEIVKRMPRDRQVVGEPRMPAEYYRAKRRQQQKGSK